MMDSVKANIQTRRPLSSVRPQAMSFYSLLDKPGLANSTNACSLKLCVQYHPDAVLA